ncbi:peptide deformylase [Candidatus Methylomicrobium oryzae]|jgi:peptide deformylase|uniref:peptide deformylase n=1 Tax=Candidatus Methylomicrobium oryzae TaxID=2802053 RepID=UPI00192145A1|nr:peptide deformylase [Methylomicrobium sp. RS1]MBL1263728.1 peptide deformylase [Methylomicrobium sp. RS1]
MNQIREIAQLGAEVLRCQAQLVAEAHSAESRAVIAAMKATLANTQGVGLAAPQIGESLRIVIVASRPTPRYPDAPLMEPTVMINPSFETLSETTEKGWEGCLSIPGIRALVPRFKDIRVDYTDEQGHPVRIRLQDFIARVFQHEFDHLNGLVFLDRVENNRDIFSESEYLKLFS